MPPLPDDRQLRGGTALCLLSALAYTAANVCMRQLTAVGCDPAWAVFNREFVTTLLVAPWLLYRAARGRTLFPDHGTMATLLLTGLLIQVVGNLCAQWALGIVGLAVTVPLIAGVTITSGAVLGRLWLGERVSPRSAAAIAVLLASLVLLGMGVAVARGTMAASQASPAGLGRLLLALAAAGLAGSVFAVLSVAIRHSVLRTATPSAIAFLVPLMGAVSLGPVCLTRLGMAQLLSTPPVQVALMAAAGVLNLVGFLALIHGLQRTTVVHANVVTASQVAMAAVAGLAIFHEPPNPWLLLGITLTIVGVLRVDRPAEPGGL